MKLKIKASDNCSLCSLISASAPISKDNIKKLIKQREVKVNGMRVSESVELKVGDEVEIFVPRGFLGESAKIIYEDSEILIADKPVLTDINVLTESLRADREYFEPLHRLDRNTTGLVVFALNKSAFFELSEAFKRRTVDKFYQAIVVGKVQDGLHEAYLFKDEDKAVCYVSPVERKGYKKIQTITRTIEYHEGLSLVEVVLKTGRTHQIRAHLAYMGAPVLGDGKYGIETVNRKYGCKYQQLTAYKIIFHQLEKLSYLNEKVFVLNRKLLTKSIL